MKYYDIDNLEEFVESKKLQEYFLDNCDEFYVKFDKCKKLYAGNYWREEYTNLKGMVRYTEQNWDVYIGKINSEMRDLIIKTTDWNIPQQTLYRYGYLRQAKKIVEVNDAYMMHLSLEDDMAEDIVNKFSEISKCEFVPLEDVEYNYEGGPFQELLNRREHRKIIDELLDKDYANILDLGSGKTSMNILLDKYEGNKITGICYPGDERKIKSIKKNCKGKYKLKEQDICKSKVKGKYDLVLCHLLLGETLKFGNVLEDMLNSIFNIDTKCICIVDYLEDIDIDYDLVKSKAGENGFKTIKQKVFVKKEEQVFETFIGKSYIGLVFERE